MSRNWIRVLRLDVAGTQINLTGADDARDDAGLRVRFTIRDSTVQTPRVAEIRISNLSDATAQKIFAIGAKGDAVAELIGGYRDHSGRIFKGQIRQVRVGRENPTDTYVDVFAATGDRAYNYANVSKTLKAGSTGKDIYDTCLKAMQPFGIVQGQVPDALARIRYPRPVTLFGMARTHLRDLAASASCTWNIRDDSLDVIPKDGARPGNAVVLNSRAGMIGMPTQTELGIVVRCLINPAIGINSVVKIDEASIQKAALNLSYGSEALNSEPYLPRVATDGLYRVISLDVSGDTHGELWYYDMACIARNGGVVPQPQAALGRGGDGADTYIAPTNAFIGKN